MDNTEHKSNEMPTQHNLKIIRRCVRSIKNHEEILRDYNENLRRRMEIRNRLKKAYRKYGDVVNGEHEAIIKEYVKNLEDGKRLREKFANTSMKRNGALREARMLYHSDNEQRFGDE